MSILQCDTDPQVPLVPATTRLRELELMQQWCTKTCHSFTTTHSEIFQNNVVKEALKHECLMQAILAFSSAHIACTMDGSDLVGMGPYVQTALQYQSEAMSSLQVALHDLSPSRCGAVFTSSMITMACSIVLPLFPQIDHNRDLAVPSIESVLHLFEFLKGINSVVEVSRQWLTNGPFKTVFSTQFYECFLSESERDGFIQHLHVLNEQFYARSNPSQHQVYQRAINMFEIVFTTHKFKIFQWLLETGEGVMDGLRRKEPMALILLLQWGTLISQLKELWWAKYLGERIVDELSRYLSESEVELGELSQWIKVQVVQKREVNRVSQ